MTSSKLYEILNMYKDHEALDLINEKYLALIPDVPEEEQILVWEQVCAITNPKIIEHLLSIGWRAAGVEDRDGNTLLHLLVIPHRSINYNIAQGDIYESTLKLLAAKVSPLRKNKYGETALHLSVKDGHVEMLQAFAEMNAKIDFLDPEGRNLLHLIAEYSSPAISAFTDTANQLNNFPTTSDFGPNHLAKRREELEQRHELNTVRFNRFVAYAATAMIGGFDPHQKNSENKTALETAIERKVKVIAAIFNGIDFSDEETAPLYFRAGGMNVHQACINKDVDALDALITLGNNINEAYDKEGDRYHGMTPLAIAMTVHNFEITEYLINNGADAKLLDSKSWHPFRYLYIPESSINTNSDQFKDKTFVKILKAYISKGFELDSFIDDDENTLLTISAKYSDGLTLYNDDTIAKVLTEEAIYAGADVNKTNKLGISPLMYICLADARRGERNLVTLLEQGASTELRDINGKTTLMYAVTNSNHTVAQTYCELLAEFGNLLINEADNNQKTALDYAAEKNYESLVAWLVGKM